MKTILTTGWNFFRILRLALGLIILIVGISNHDTLLGIAGGFLLLMAVLNIGCCGIGSCPTRPQIVKSERDGRMKK